MKSKGPNASRGYSREVAKLFVNILVLNCWEATEKSEKGLRSLTKIKARRKKTGALIRQPQYLQEDNLKAEVFL